MTHGERGRAAVTGLWLVVCCVAVAGYVVAVRIEGGRADERIAANALTAERLRAGSITLAQRPRLEAERARLRGLLRGVDTGDATRLVAEFVRDAAHESARLHTVITAIGASNHPAPATAPVNSATTTPAATTTTSANTDPIVLLPLDVTLEGRYLDVLATIRRLSRMHVVAAVEVGALARTNADSSDATLSAALRVSLAHLSSTDRDRARTE